MLFWVGEGRGETHTLKRSLIFKETGFKKKGPHHYPRGRHTSYLFQVPRIPPPKGCPWRRGCGHKERAGMKPVPAQKGLLQNGLAVTDGHVRTGWTIFLHFLLSAGSEVTVHSSRSPEAAVSAVPSPAPTLRP